MAPRHPAALLIETLEPRILYSADLMPIASAGSTPVAGEQQLFDQNQPTTAQTELLFVDARIDNYQTLVDDFMARAGVGRQIEVIVIGADEDGVAKIGETLGSRQDVAAIHLLSHGESGAISLGNSRLDSDTLLARAPEIADWGSALGADGDILVYGCDVAEGSAGKLFIDQLASLTGADVAASENLTGSSALGGDWNLEYRVGALEYTVSASPWAGPDWQGVLATYTVTNTGDSGAGSLRQAITSANSNAGTDTINFTIAGTGVHTITLASALPTITGTVILDATTDDSFAANGNRPAVILNVGGASTGLSLVNADNSTIRGLAIQNFGIEAITLDANTSGTTIAGNYIGLVGTDGNYAAAGSTGTYAITVYGANNVIGGSNAADRNVIAATTYNIYISGTAAAGNQVIGNYVGVNASGTAILTGSGEGITLWSNSSATTVTNNVIATDQNIRNGINDVGLGNNVIQGNRIGTDATGTVTWGVNQHGIWIKSSNNLIGGTGAGQGNVVAYSNKAAGDFDGIYISSGILNAILGNAVYGTNAGTSGLGIDLGFTGGVTLNDAGDSDAGANNLQNFPVLTSALSNGIATDISGTLNSTANNYYRIEFFSSPTANSSGYGEGKIFLGFVNVATNGSGNASFSVSLGNAVTAGHVISATATKSNATYTTFTDTSEFAQNITVTAATPGVLVVDTASDTNDGNTTSISNLQANKGADGFISLREAIIAANNTANVGGVADTINFGIAGTGVHTITLGSVLPSITDAVILDATTDDSFAANGNKPAVILDGANGNFAGLRLTSTADGSTIRGFVIRNFRGDGIILDAGADGNTIAGNYVGQLNASGTVAGTGNGNAGIYVYGANNVIGGTTALDRNVVAGNLWGIEVNTATASGNQVIGNYIGTDATGLTTLGNAQRGVVVFGGATGNTIGGSSTTQRNLISGNGSDAVNIDGETSDNNVVRGNWIGVGADGSTLLGNGNDGIFISGGADNTQVGGAGANDGNWVAGVTFVGIEIDGPTSGTVIQGNRIGTDLAGSANWGTGQNGILIENSGGGAGPSSNSVVGNTIAFAGQTSATFNAGVRISSTAGNGNTVSANSLYSNGGLGIDLNGDGVTANDTGDGDTGPNNLQNFPVLTLAKTDGTSQLSVSGTLNSTASSYFRIELFASPAADSTGYGEGQIYLGFVNVATNASGNATFSTTLAASVPVGYSISATATKSDATYSTFTDTSEFARDIVAVSATQAMIVVDTSADTLDGDTTSLSTLIANKGADGFISLREAISAANNTANGSGGADRILFQIAGTGVHTITLGSALPDLTGSVILDASTDDSFAANGSRPAIVLDGANGNFNGLNIAAGASGSTIRGFVITNVQGRGILINPGSTNNTIAGNYIGKLTAAGTQGTTTTGLWGISVLGNNNIIGGSTAADRNVISGNGLSGAYYGIYIGGTQNNQVLGNYFGSDATGTSIITNTDYAVVLDNGSTGNIIGGAGAAGNLFLGKGAVWIFGENSDGNTVQGNQIGLAADGTTVLGITGYGIRIQNGGDNNIIGGTGSLGNVLLGVQGTALEIYGNASGNVVQGNYIGIDRTLTVTGTNTSDIAIDGGAHDNLIGGVNAGEGNYLTASTGSGIYLTSAAGVNNTLLRNLVWNTTRTGIDLQGGTESGTGATTNDVGDADTGPNLLQNTPVLSLVKTNGSSQVDISGTLNSTASSYYRLEFFAKPANGSSATYLGFVNVATDGSGNANFSTSLAVSVPVGYSISATATKSNATYTTFTDTSEFARDVVAISSTQGVLVVDTASDTTDGDTTSLSTLLANKGADGFISLREAIAAANNTANGSLADLINFGIAGTGVHSITLGSSLPSISDTVILDASTDDSFAANGSKPAVIIDVNGINASNGLRLTSTADGSTIRGFVISNFKNAAITIDSGSSGNTIAGNYLGPLDASGNYVAGLATSSYTVLVQGDNNIIGGSSAADRNIIASTGGNYGVFVNGASAFSNRVIGNYLGTDATGNTAVGGALTGASLFNSGSSNQIGGSGIGEGNVFGNGTPVYLFGAGSGSLIQGNKIGVAASGSATLSGVLNGIQIGSGNNVSIIDNWIAGASNYGIYVQTGVSGTIIQGNRIGTDLAGTANWGTQRDGILIQGGSNSLIGGTSAAQTNVITNSNQAGLSYDAIDVSTGTGNAILGNSIFGTKSASGSLGIDLDSDGVTANDSGDGDTGANNLQNFPVLTLAKTDGSSQITLSGTLNSTASSYFRIELFGSPTAGTNGYGEGKTYLGFVNVATDGSGNATFSTTLSASVPIGYLISATATKCDVTYTTFTDTSEFAASLTAGGAPVNTVPGAQSVNEDTVLTLSGISVADQGSLSLTVGLSALHGTLNVNLAGGATISAGTNNTAALTLTGSVAQVNAALATLTYQGNADYYGNDTLSVASTDPSTLSASSSVSITVLAVNDAPTISNGTIVVLTGTDENTTTPPLLVSSLLTSAGWADVDTGALKGIAISAAVGNGTWQYSTNGVTWTAFGSVSASSALLLTDSSQIRYIPDGNNGETATFDFKAWDQTTGSASLNGAPSYVNPGAGGGSTAYSSQDASASLTVSVVNDAPIITSNGGGATAGITLAENTSAVTTVTATDADLPAQTLTYSISGADAGRFSIDANTGVLTFSPAPDYDSPADSDTNNIYEVTVTVSDGSLSDSQNISVTVTPLNDNAPVISSNGGGPTANINVAENNLAVTTVTATDADLPAQTLTYSIIGGADSGQFSIDSNTGALSFLVAPDFELPADSGGNNVYDLIVQASDGSLSVSQTITVTVTNQNDNGAGPISDTNVAANSLPENAGNGTAVGITALAVDPDVGDTISYSLDNDAGGRFAIDINTGIVTVANGTLLNYEASTSHNIVVRATSSDTSFTTANFTVTLTDVNEFAVSAVSDTNVAADTVAENAANGTVVGITAFASDADATSSAVTYSLSNDAGGRFAIDATTGIVTVANSSLLNYEAATSHAITVLASSADGSTSSQAFTINLSDVNEFAISAISDTDASANGVAENAANGTAVGITAFASDADGTINAVTYSLDNDAGGRFVIDASTGIVTVDNSSLLNYEAASSHNILVRATSTDTSFATANFTVTLSDVNEFAISAVSDTNAATDTVAENSANGTVVGITAFAADADGTTSAVTYSLSNDAGGRFAIDANTGIVTVANSNLLDYEAAISHAITVLASSTDGSTSSQAFTINLADVNEFAISAVSDTNVASNSVAENSANGTVVGVTAFATDADGTTNTVTYSLSNNAGGRFAIDANTGIVTVANSSLLDFEAATSHAITVLASSTDGSTSSLAFTINLTDVNEFAISAVSDTNVASNSVAENSANGALVGITAFASDADAATNTVTYSLSNNAGGRFAIDANTGIVTVANSSLLDFEAATSHAITVLASSTDGSTSSLAFTISLNDVNEFAVSSVSDTNAAADTVAENAANGTVVGITAFASDADASTNAITYTLSNDAGGRFAIDANTGIVTIANGTLLDYEAATSHAITVLASSADGSTSSQTFTISLNDVNEFAVSSVSDTNAAADTVAENAANGTVVGITAFASDADASTNAITYTLSNDAGGRFAIDANTGIVTIANGTLLDYEAATSHSITVLASSADGSTSSQAFTINLTDVNEFAISAVNDTDAAADTVAENSANGALVGITAFASDADATTNAVTYSLSNDAGGRFAIDANTGIVTVANSSLLDYEAATSHAITVLASSADGSTSSQVLTISLTPINDNTPAITSNGGGATATVNVAENTTAVTTVAASDADLPSQILTYSIIGGADAGQFAINSSTGALSFITAPDFEAPADSGGNNIYDVIVEASDGALTSSQAIAVSVFNSNEAPTTSLVTLTAIAEDSGPRLITQAELLANAADVDGPSLSAVGLAISTGSGSLVDNGNGTWTYTPALNANGSVSFAYTVTDGSLTAAGSTTLGITPVNDAPTMNAGTTTTLPSTDQLTTSGTTSVASLLTSGAWADVDSAALKGVAILGSSGAGTWQYSTDGSTWIAFGNVSGSNALLLAETSQVRYVPDGITGEIASFSYLAWDQTAGNASTNSAPSYANPGAGGGSSAYSSQQGAISLTVSQSGTVQPPPSTTPTIPIVPIPPVTPVSPTPPASNGPAQAGTASSAAQQAPVAALPAIGDLFFTPAQPTGAGHFELASIAGGPDQLRTGSSEDFYSTRRWNVSYPKLQFSLQSIALQSAPDFNLNAITQVAFTGSFSADRGHDESSGIPVVLDQGFDKLISPGGVIAATGAVFSAGMIWWGARAGGLMASLALSLPTWRNIDPLSVVGRKADDPEDWGIDNESDLERVRDEKAVTGMLEDMTEQRL